MHCLKGNILSALKNDFNEEINSYKSAIEIYDKNNYDDNDMLKTIYNNIIISYNRLNEINLAKITLQELYKYFNI